jgi:hypothetical protein
MRYYCVISYQCDTPHQVKRYRWPFWLRWERLARFEPATPSHFITSDNSKHALHSPTLNRSFDKFSAVHPWLPKVYLVSVTELMWLFPRLVSQLFIYTTFISCGSWKPKAHLLHTVGLTWLFPLLAILRPYKYETIISNVESIHSTHCWAHVNVHSFRPSSPLQVWDDHIECRKNTQYTLLGSRDYVLFLYSHHSNHRCKNIAHNILTYDWP